MTVWVIIRAGYVVWSMFFIFYFVRLSKFFFVVTSLHVSDVMLLLWQLQFFQENAEYIENWIHSRISHNRISRNLRQCCPGRYLLSCFDKGYDR